MDWTTIAIYAFIVGLFIIFLVLWFTGMFDSKGVTGSTGINNIIQANIDILMPPSVWSKPVLNGPCYIYNFPIVDGKFPFVTNNGTAISGLQKVTSNRCYWSNELALAETYQTCNATTCYDDQGNSYSNGQRWSYYQQCGNSCYGSGQILSIVALVMNNPTFPPMAIIPNGTGPAEINVTIQQTNLAVENQYHIVQRYSSTNTAKADQTGHFCNIVHSTSGLYLDAVIGDVSYPIYVSGKPKAALWLLAPPNSIGGIAQVQSIVYVGNIGPISSNPSLVEYAAMASKYNLKAMNVPGSGDTLVNKVVLDQVLNPSYGINFNSQIIDLSRYDLLVAGSTSKYPYYRWSNAFINY